MPLDPQALLYLQIEQTADEESTLSLAEQRLLAKQAALLEAGDPEEVAGIEDRQIPGPLGPVPVRIYTPSGADERLLPGLVYFHSGGWVFGSIEAHDPVCRALSNAAQCRVVSVGYRLAPEHRFPAAPEDCYAATQWVASQARQLQIDAERIAVGGDSAGGNLAAAVALMARDRQGPDLCYQIIIYGETDYYDSGAASYQTYAEGYGLTRASMIYFWDTYLERPEDGSHPYASPLRAASFRDLPPALIITAEYDPVRDEAELYARRLAEAGIAVKLSRYPGMIHSFFRMFAHFKQSRQVLEEVARALHQTSTSR
ncbi:MAG TPA: alpha/beta hydrolase [Ktedonobacteraceae bacterium]|nr:alpha/beta hydrolase [Ktedonobacteraceae bacterium]